MMAISEIRGLIDEWIAAVVRAVDLAIGRYARRSQITLHAESADILTARLTAARNGPALPEISFRLSNGRPSPSLPANWEAAFRGSRVEMVMAPGQVLFRPLDFPRQAPFAHVNELSLVLGVSPAMVERALPYLTVFSRSADVDVLIAPPEVVAALPGMTPEALNDFLKQRSSLPRDKNAIAAALGPAAKAAGTLPQAKSFRILTALRFGNGRRTSSEVVIALSADKAKEQANNNNNNAKANNNDKANNKDKGPYTILSWQDDVEIATRSLRQTGG